MILLTNVSREVLITIYRSMQVLSFPALAVFAAWYAPKYDISRKRGTLYALSVYVVLFAIMYLQPKLLGLLGIKDSLTSSRCVLFVLAPTALLTKRTGISALHGSDFVVPALFTARVIGKLGCFVFGCCHGFHCDWGVYSPAAGTRVFPLQLVEIGFCLFMMFGCVWYANRYSFRANGRVYGLATTIFGVERYLIQFFTTDYRFTIGFNMQSIYAILMVLLGLIVFYVADKKKVEL